VAEKNYRAIAAKKITRPSKMIRMPKILIYGRNKKGKTTFGISAGIENTLVLDPEYGTSKMKIKDPHVWPIERWEDIEEAYQYLRLGDHPYTWAVVDGLTKMSNMALNYVMRQAEEKDLGRQPGMVQQRDYGKAGELLKAMLNNFYNLHTLGVIFTAQERMIEGVDSEEDEDSEDVAAMYVPDLPKGARSAANSIVDVIGRIYTVKVQHTDGSMKTQRRLWLSDSDKYDTGYRSEFVLPDMLKMPTVPKLVRLIDEGKALPAKKAAAPKKRTTAAA
jgi:AAA domain